MVLFQPPVLLSVPFATLTAAGCHVRIYTSFEVYTWYIVALLLGAVGASDKETLRGIYINSAGFVRMDEAGKDRRGSEVTPERYILHYRSMRNIAQSVHLIVIDLIASPTCNFVPGTVRKRVLRIPMLLRERGRHSVTPYRNKNGLSLANPPIICSSCQRLSSIA